MLLPGRPPVSSTARIRICHTRFHGTRAPEPAPGRPRDVPVRGGYAAAPRRLAQGADEETSVTGPRLPTAPTRSHRGPALARQGSRLGAAAPGPRLRAIVPRPAAGPRGQGGADVLLPARRCRRAAPPGGGARLCPLPAYGR